MWIHQGNPKMADTGTRSKRNAYKRSGAHKITMLYQSSKAAEECEKMWIIRGGWPNMGEAGWAKETWSKDLDLLLCLSPSDWIKTTLSQQSLILLLIIIFHCINHNVYIISFFYIARLITLVTFESILNLALDM